MKRAVAILVSALVLLTFSLPVSAADYPNDSITYSIPFNPGGQSDLEARRQQPMLEKILGQKIVIQYKPGGGGSVGWADLTRQKADGYFMSGINVPHIILQPMARGNAGFETSDLQPVAFFQATPIGLAVLKDAPWQNLEELITYATENPGAIIAGGSGTWSGHHIAHLQLQDMLGINMTYVPYKGAAPSVAGFLGGHVQALWANSNDLYQHRDKLRVLAFGTEKPFPNMPEVPTFESKGISLYASIDRGAAVPKGTPASVVKTLEDAFHQIVSDPKVQEQMKNDGFVPMFLNAEESQQYIDKMAKVWAPVVKKFKK